MSVAVNLAGTTVRAIQQLRDHITKEFQKLFKEAGGKDSTLRNCTLFIYTEVSRFSLIQIFLNLL